MMIIASIHILHESETANYFQSPLYVFLDEVEYGVGGVNIRKIQQKNMTSPMVWRRLGLVLLGIVVGLTLAVWHGVFVSPVNFLHSAEQGSHAPLRTFSGRCGANLSHTKEEEIRTSTCVTSFASFRAKYGSVDRPKMEIDRVDSHSYLTADSRVLEVGGYTGVDAAKLIKKYNPHYLALEPVPRYYTILEQRYNNNPKYKLFKFGLGKENKTLLLNIDNDATSLFRAKHASNKTKEEVAYIHEIKGFFKSVDVYTNPIDLITINCEGCEYELLELLISSEIVTYLKNIQFQFHLDLPGIANQECRYCQIMTLLSRTHRPTFQYSYIWQSWRLKNI
ncbi:uncharacterized protein LOC124142831 isoform X3 [Haliotis rufescens]|uniref:uncharacterized protein LOC124142831 isoform X3 n=1 Tax=Haliotis rufescens TaxID=6454 RepID=UPI00201F6B50|nr:uncharacterized protein LOC124142831 isoform X3 [Haliotis rufescens]